jgi:hypothetical protein
MTVFDNECPTKRQSKDAVAANGSSRHGRDNFRRRTIRPRRARCTSVNPARSTGVAFFNGDGAPAQLWVFWLAPLVGAAIAGVAYPYLFGSHEELADRPVRDDALEESAAT